MTDKTKCEYCGESLPIGVDRRTRQIRSAHFQTHAEERLAKRYEEGVELLAWINREGQLVWYDGYGHVEDDWRRVPSEDKWVETKE